MNEDDENVELGYDITTRSAELEYREDAEGGYLEGIAVPWDETVTIRNADGSTFEERFQNGSVELDGTVWLYDSHRTPIGEVVSAETRSEGLFIRAKLALSDLAKSVYGQLKAGALNRLSVGFTPLEHSDDNGVVVRTRTRLREVSVVARPAYAGATVLAVREETPTEREPLANTKENTVTENTASAAELAEVRGEIEELRQEISTRSAAPAHAEPVIDTRSAAEVLTALVRNDEDTVRAYNALYEERAYTGGTSSDAPMQKQWVGDLTRIFDASSGILSETFSRGTLPAKGNTLEYGKLNTVSGTVSRQVNEGDDLPFTKVTLTTATAPVYTYGGYTQLTRQAIERSTMPLLQRNLEYLALQAGVNKKKVLRDDFDAVVAANRAVAANAGVILGGAALGSMDAAKWLTTVLAANKRYKAQGYSVEKLIVTDDVFAHLLGLTTTGDRVLRIAEGNSAGSASVPRLSATLFGLPVEVDDTPSSGAATAQAVFVHGDAIRQYDSAVVSLQDENIINLSKDFSVYRYGAIADEQPSLIIPVKFAAS